MVSFPQSFERESRKIKIDSGLRTAGMTGDNK